MQRTTEPDPKDDREPRAAPTVLVVATPGENVRGLHSTLARRGYALALAETGEQGVRALANEKTTQVVILVLPLRDTTGRDVMRALREIDSHVPVIVMGKDSEIDGAASAMENGAAEHVGVDANPQELLGTVGFLIGARRGDRHLKYLHAKQLSGAGWETLIGESAPLHNVVSMLQQVVARTQRGATPTIFLGGETGTGKGFIAKCVHANSVRRNRLFVEVNCAALPASLMEAELFGHERGSFTDAKTARPGLFETADGGTLFLDEIGAVPLDLQAKLLTAIEEKRVRRLGARQGANVDVQIIAATHEDLRRKAREGTFREDLFHRLNVVSVTIPALRERGDDVILLAESFLRASCREYGIPPRQLSADAKKWMRGYGWPGNVRELRNQLERIVLLVDDDLVRAEHFQTSADGPKSTRVGVTQSAEGRLRVELPPDGVDLAELERAILAEALKQTDGNVSRAARYLRISRQTFIYRMKKHGLDADGK